MNRRIAIKIGRLAHPRYGIGRVKRAERKLWTMRRGCCHDCPVGRDDESGGLCPNRKACDAWEGASAAILAADVGQHPWGNWKCSMQVAMGL